MSIRFCSFEARLSTSFEASHYLEFADDPAGRVPHRHVFRVTVGWKREASCSGSGVTLDADAALIRIRKVIDPLEGADLNELVTQPSAEVIAAYLLDLLSAGYFDWVEVSHRPDYAARIDRKGFSKEWLAMFRKAP